MEYYEKRFSSPEVHLYVLVDWHYGSPRCDEKLLRKVIKLIREDENGVWVGAGDLTENNLENSMGSTYEQTLNPEEQLYGRRLESKLLKEGLIDILKPIAKKGLFMVEGNHGYRTTKFTGLVPDKIVCAELGIPFMGIGCLGKLYIKDTMFKFLVHHGHGGSRTMGGKITNALRVRALAPTCDLTISGHTHAIAVNSVVWFDTLQGGTGNHGNPLYESIGWDYVCGSLLTYGGSYAERKLMPPAARGQLMIKLGNRTNGRMEKPQRYEIIN